MKKIYRVLIIPLLCISAFTTFHSPLFGQDPGMLINVVLLKDGKEITDEKECATYSILLRRSMAWATYDSVKAKAKAPYSLYGNYKQGFEIFSWDPYHEEVIQLCILHGSDSMVVSVKDSVKYWWNAFFYLKIPFRKGHYEITKLEERNDLKGTQGLTHGYAIPAARKWKAIRPKKRKLLINGH